MHDEKQDGKIPCYVNGYINLMNNDANDNLMLMFFNTANELTCLDVDVLRMYSSNSEGNILTLCDKYNLIPEQTMVIKEKLARLGLLQSNNDEIRDNNLDYVVGYLEDQDYARRHKSQKDIRLSKTKIKKVNRADSFHITNLGESFLKTVSD